MSGSDIISIFRSGSSQGFIWAILVIGVFISYRLLDKADLTIEGSFPLGACMSAMLIINGVNPWISLLVAFMAGIAAGIVTALLHTVFKIPVLIGGIITMTGLNSINRAICSRSAIISLLNADNIFAGLQSVTGLNKAYSVLIISFIVLIVVSILIYLFFGTELGAAIRGTGMNPKMAKSLGINTSIMEIIGLGLSNGLIALAGAILAQSSGQASIEFGRGAIVVGLASIILGEVIFGKRNFMNNLISVVIGSWIYQIILSITVQFGVDELWIKLLSAIFIAVVLALPIFKGWFNTLYLKIKPSKARVKHD